MLYQYTSVSSLALILSNRTIRFTALNLMDDLQEQETSDIKNLGQFCFVSCWTEDAEEQIPMWKMYTTLEAGVRIRLPKYPFLEVEDRPEDIAKVVGMPVKDSSGGVHPKGLIPAWKMIKEGFITPGLLKQESILFCLDDYVLDIPYLRHENSSLSVIVLFRKIRVNTPLQVLCLADIDDGTSLVEILIAAWALWQIADNAHQIGSETIFFFPLHLLWHTPLFKHL